MAKVPEKFGLAKLLCEVRVTPTLKFCEEMLSVAAKLEGHFRYWRTDGKLQFRFLDADARVASIINHNRLAVEMDLPRDLETFEKRYGQVSSLYLKSTNIKSILRVGVRGQYFFTSGFKFEELVSILDEKLLRISKERDQILAGRVRDLMFNVVIERSSHLLHIICGPVKREEVRIWTTPITYDIGESPEPIEYPEVSTFMDLDYYTDKIASGSEVDGIFHEAVNAIDKTSREFFGYLFEEKVK